MSDTDTTPDTKPEPKVVDANDHFMKFIALEVGTVYVNPGNVVAILEDGGYAWSAERRKYEEYLYTTVSFVSHHDRPIRDYNGLNARDMKKIFSKARPDLHLVKLHRDLPIPRDANNNTRRFYGYVVAEMIDFVYSREHQGNTYTVLHMTDGANYALSDPIADVVKHIAEQLEKVSQDKSFCLCQLPPAKEGDAEE